MSSLADLPELVGFFSYSREDDEDSFGTLSALRDRIQRELRGQLGRSMRSFRLWQDKEAIAAGKLWESEIKTAVAQSVFFIPIITPTVVRSRYCRFELESFLAREAELGRDDLVFPILYIKIPAMDDSARLQDDPVLSIIAKRQYIDWRELRLRDVNSTDTREAVERFCTNICDALHQPWVSPQQREALALQQAEDERKRRATEAKRIEEEEREKARRESEITARRKLEAQQAFEDARRAGSAHALTRFLKAYADSDLVTEARTQLSTLLTREQSHQPEPSWRPSRRALIGVGALAAAVFGSVGVLTIKPPPAPVPVHTDVPKTPPAAAPLPPVKATKILDAAALDRLKANSGIALQWISWDYLGRLNVTDKGGVVHLEGSQIEKKGAGRLEISGDVVSIDQSSFTFQGKINIYSTPSDRKECPRDGIFDFRITNDRHYWRLQQMQSCGDSTTDYVDIFF